MMVSLDTTQAEVLREILESQLKQLEIESARTDAHDFRERLHERTKVVESMLAQLPS
jgi:hypothetical protein